MTPEPAGSHDTRWLSPLVAGLLASLAAALLWLVLAAWRPTVTLHLAPVLVASTGPYVAWTRAEPGRRRATVLAALGAALLAITATLGLSAAGWLAGPTWFATDATREAAVLIGATTSLAVVGAGWARTAPTAAPAVDRDRR